MDILSFPEVFIHSSNVGVIKIAELIGEENLYQMFKTFRFGEKTGIDLPGEEAGIFHPLEKWRKSSLRVAIGYEIAATPLQILRAMNVFATGGYLIKPRVKLEQPRPLHQIINFGQEPLAEARQIVSQPTAKKLVEQIFNKVVEEGTGQQAWIPGYLIAGKTGTAQKFDPELKAYSNSKHVASFVGFVPADQPVISVVVVIDEPKGFSHYGGQVAAPVFREIARKVLLYLNQPPRQVPEKIIAARRNQSETGVND
jgi:cell division protein FtsI (penicillin-binding protein 3)